MATQAWISFERGHRHQGKFYEGTIPSGNPKQAAEESGGKILLSPPDKKKLVSHLTVLEEDYNFFLELWEKVRADMEEYAMATQAAVVGRTIEAMFNEVEQSINEIRDNEKNPNRAEWFKDVAKARRSLSQVKDEMDRISVEMADTMRQANIIRIANMQQAKAQAQAQAASKA